MLLVLSMKLSREWAQTFHSCGHVCLRVLLIAVHALSCCRLPLLLPVNEETLSHASSAAIHHSHALALQPEGALLRLHTPHT